MPNQTPTVLFYEYRESQDIAANNRCFYALIMAAMMQADTINAAKLQAAWPEVFAELQARYNAPAGALTENELTYVRHERGAY